MLSNRTPNALDIACSKRNATHRKRLQSPGDEARVDDADRIGKVHHMAVISSSSHFNRRALLGAGIGGAGLLATGCSIFDSTSRGGAEGGAGGQGPAITIARPADLARSEEHPA